MPTRDIAEIATANYIFSPGDEVIALDDNGYGITTNGWVGIVIEICDDDPRDMKVEGYSPLTDSFIYRVRQSGFKPVHIKKETTIDIMDLYKGE